MRTILVVLLAVWAGVMGCRARTVPRVPPASAVRLVTGEWRLVDLYAKGVGEGGSGSGPWIRIEEGGALSGWAGVNQISSRLDQDGLAKGEFKSSAVIATRMAGPPEAMRIEREFVRALGEARTYSARGDGLDLWNEAGQVVASFARKR